MSLGLIKRGMCLHIQGVGTTLVVDVMGRAEPQIGEGLKPDEPVNAFYTCALLVHDEVHIWKIDVGFWWPGRVDRITARILPEENMGISLRTSVWHDAWIIPPDEDVWIG
jgi:hypothetical protein